MNEKETAEIRRRLRPDKNNITHICGCYVNEKKEVLSLFDQPMSTLPQEESEAYLALLKRSLSGVPGKNLLEIEFSTAQVADSDEHGLLMALRDSRLKDQGAVEAFYQRTIDSLDLPGNFLILLAQDIYDVPYRSRSGDADADAGDETFSYLLCSICPVKMARAALTYSAPENEFHNREAGWIVAAPELGFLFPAFDDRSTNLYNALYYTKDTAQNHPDFMDKIFHTEIPLPAEVQKETFQSVLSETLAEECSLDVVQAVHEQLCAKIEEHKQDKESELPAVSGSEMRRVLERCGVSAPRMDAFEEKFNSEFGAETRLSPQNLADTKQFELRTPSVVIKVDPACGDLVETRMIDGLKYIVIRASDGVEVNGVPIRIAQESQLD